MALVTSSKALVSNSFFVLFEVGQLIPPRPLDQSVTCDFNSGSCGWQFHPALHGQTGFVYSQANIFQMFTQLHLPAGQLKRLTFTYRVIPADSGRLRLWFSCWKMTDSMFVKQMLLDGGADGLHKEWRKVKLSVPANVFGLIFESEDAELSIDNIYMTSADVASVHSAYVVAGGHSCVLHVARGQVHCWGSGSSGQLGQGNTENIGDDMNLGCPQVVP